MVAPISGARPIHSLTGPAIAVAAMAHRAERKGDDEERRDPR